MSRKRLYYAPTFSIDLRKGLSMRALLLISSLFFASVLFSMDGAAASSSNKSESQSVPQLQCVTIDVPPIAKNAKSTKSCDDICQDHAAACVGMLHISVNPPPSCASAADGVVDACRCCSISEAK